MNILLFCGKLRRLGNPRLFSVASCALQDLASDLLCQASELTSQARLPSKQRFLMCRQVIITCLDRGQQCLAAKDPGAIELLKHAYKLITEHLVRMQDTVQLLCLHRTCFPGYSEFRWYQHMKGTAPEQKAA